MKNNDFGTNRTVEDMATTIEDYLRLTVKDCKRLGFFVPQHDSTGVVRWTQGKNLIASVSFRTNLTGAVPYAALTYQYKGTPVHTELTLRFKPSNLKGDTGYYYFVCPVTGLSCRNLYLVNGQFVSRTAFRPLYRTQAETKVGINNGSLAVLRAIAAYEDMTTAKYRRLTYRGKLTPWGRKVEKMADKAGAIYERTVHRAETYGWGSV